MLLVAVPLALTSINVARETRTAINAQKFAKLWLKESDFELTRVVVDRNNTKIIINGMGDPPSLSDIDKDLQSLLEGTKVTIKIVPSRTLHYPLDDYN